MIEFRFKHINGSVSTALPPAKESSLSASAMKAADTENHRTHASGAMRNYRWQRSQSASFEVWIVAVCICSMSSIIHSKFQLQRKLGRKFGDPEEIMRKAACEGEKTLHDLKFEESKSVNCVNKDKPSSHKHKPNWGECEKNLIARDLEMAMDWRLCRNPVQSTFQNPECPVTFITEETRSLHCSVVLRSHLPNCEVKRKRNNWHVLMKKTALRREGEQTNACSTELCWRYWVGVLSFQVGVQWQC